MNDTITTTLDALNEYGVHCEIRSTVYHFNEYAWSSYQNGGPTPDEAPQAGERSPMSYFCNGYQYGGKCSCSDEFQAVQFVEVREATWGDYMDTSLYNRHNHTALLEDYEEFFVDVYGDFFSHMLLLPVGIEVPELLLDELAGLMDYPIYDEDGYNQFCAEVEFEEWESYGRADLRNAMDRAAREAGDDEFHAEDEYDDEALDKIAHEAMNDGVLMWYPESSQGGYFDGLEQLGKDTYTARQDAIARGWERYATDLTREQQAGMEPLI